MRHLPDITTRVKLIDRTEELGAQTGRWENRSVPVEPGEACDLCDGRVLASQTIYRFKRYGDPYVAARLHAPCFDFYVMLRNQPT